VIKDPYATHLEGQETKYRGRGEGEGGISLCLCMHRCQLSKTSFKDISHTPLKVATPTHHTHIKINHYDVIAIKLIIIWLPWTSNN
jgi:hypothetical protein